MPTLKDARRLGVHNLQYEAAIAIYEMEWLRVRSNPRHLVDLGLCYDHVALRYGQGSSRRRRLEARALATYRRALALRPNYDRALWGIARVYWHRRSRTALRYAEAAYRARHAARYLEMQALILCSLSDYETADQLFKKARRRGRNISVNYAHYLEARGRRVEARNEARKALRHIQRWARGERESKGAQLMRRGLLKLSRAGGRPRRRSARQ